MLGLLLLEEDEELRVYLENFFPSLRVSYAKTRRNAMGPAMAPSDLVAAGITVPPHLMSCGEVYVAFTTLAMGDLNALAHAQEAHELLLEQGPRSGAACGRLSCATAAPSRGVQVGASMASPCWRSSSGPRRRRPPQPQRICPSPRGGRALPPDGWAAPRPPMHAEGLGLLCPFSSAALNRRLRALIGRSAPACRGFKAGGLRAGGATHSLRAGRSVEWLRQRGRWRVLQSLDHSGRSASPR